MKAIKRQETTFTVVGYECVQLKPDKKGKITVPDNSWIGKNVVLIKTE
jgi:hypothetical protein